MWLQLQLALTRVVIDVAHVAHVSHVAHVAHDHVVMALIMHDAGESSNILLTPCASCIGGGGGVGGVGSAIPTQGLTLKTSTWLRPP
jgi:hypothetical protein